MISSCDIPMGQPAKYSTIYPFPSLCSSHLYYWPRHSLNNKLSCRILISGLYGKNFYPEYEYELVNFNTLLYENYKKLKKYEIKNLSN